MDAQPATPVPRITLRERLRVILGGDIIFSFLNSPITIAAAAVTLFIVLAALLAPWIATQSPYDPSVLDILNSHNPPAWMKDGDWRFLLGTDEQGRDVYSTILYGSRQSLAREKSSNLSRSVSVRLSRCALRSLRARRTTSARRSSSSISDDLGLRPSARCVPIE